MGKQNPDRPRPPLGEPIYPRRVDAWAAHIRDLTLDELGLQLTGADVAAIDYALPVRYGATLAIDKTIAAIQTMDAPAKGETERGTTILLVDAAAQLLAAASQLGAYDLDSTLACVLVGKGSLPTPPAGSRPDPPYPPPPPPPPKK